MAVPTASGKSLVAYVACLLKALQGKRALYIVPLRALASEKYDDLRPLESLGISVGISMGDFDAPDPSLDKFDILVATSEKGDELGTIRVYDTGVSTGYKSFLRRAEAEEGDVLVADFDLVETAVTLHLEIDEILDYDAYE